MHIEQEVGELLLKKHLKISTAESCTGGLLSSKLTDVAGSSEYITFNVVTYANEIKNKILGVRIPEIKKLSKKNLLHILQNLKQAFKMLKNI